MTTTLETDRLVLRPRRPDEAATYRELWTERDTRVPPHRRIDAAGRPTVADIAAEIRRDVEQPAPGLLTVLRRDEGDVIGYCGLVRLDHAATDGPEIAFELLRRVHGCGYATEAGRAVVTRAAELGHPRLWATVRDWNVASRRVLAKLGFRETGRVDVDPTHGDSLLMVRQLGSSGRPADVT